MAIEPRQRSPLGAFFRTPLGAFGQGGVAPPVGGSATVTLVDVGSPFGSHASTTAGPSNGDSTCGTVKTISAGGVPDNQYWRVDFEMDVGTNFPVGNYEPVFDWTFVGDTSGEILILRNTSILTPFVCFDVLPFLDKRESYWSAGTWQLFGQTYAFESAALSQGVNQTQGFLTYVRHNSAMNWIQGESVTVTIP